jgi:hypothetical protein
LESKDFYSLNFYERLSNTFESSMVWGVIGGFIVVAKLFVNWSDEEEGGCISIFL